MLASLYCIMLMLPKPLCGTVYTGMAYYSKIKVRVTNLHASRTSSVKRKRIEVANLTRFKNI